MSFTINSLLDKYITNVRIEFIYFIIIFYALNPLRLGPLMPILLIPYVLLNASELIKNKEFMITTIILLLFAMSYSVLGLHHELFPIRRLLQIFLYPLLFFLLGHILIVKQSSYEKRLNVFGNSMFIFAFAFGSFATLSFLRTIFTFGSVPQAIEALGGRYTLGLWDDQELIPATLYAAYSSLAIVLIPLYFLRPMLSRLNSTTNLNSKYMRHIPQTFSCYLKKEWNKMKEGRVSLSSKTFFVSKIFMYVFLIVMFLVGLYSSIRIGSRTIVLMIFVSVILNLFVFGKRKFLKNFFTATAILIVPFFVVFHFNIGKFGFWVNSFSLYSTFLPERLIATIIQGDTRFSMWSQVLHGLFEYPFGGRLTYIPFGFAHNLWLDIAWDVGLIPFSLLILFTVLTLITAIKVFYNYKNIFQRTIIVQVVAILLIIFLFEPVLQNFPTYFVIYCFFSGMIYKFDDDSAKIKY